MAEERKGAKPTPRILLMEFTVEGRELPGKVAEQLKEQLETDQLPVTVTLLVNVGKAEGGPRAVIEKGAKTRGRFRAIATDSYEQGHEAIPPEQQKFELKPL